VSREIGPEWGAVYEGGTLSLSITPSSATLALERVRFGRTLIDLRARTRPDRIVVQIGVRFGPPLPVRIEIAAVNAWQVLVDENPVEGGVAALVASHEHEVQFLSASSQ
jgi:hypothetical protein